MNEVEIRAALLRLSKSEEELQKEARIEPRRKADASSHGRFWKLKTGAK
jgi:hypothetical protein